jgi:hypothetical protein
VLTIALAVTAFAAGLTGAWSPCGFSIVETVGRADARRRTLAASCAAFGLGAVIGGVATFAGLAALGRLVPGAGARLAVPAAALALLAAVAEARGVRVVPQVRRQVPEPWRRRLPLPVASAGYGVLLGLGFATFVLTLAFWVLVAASFALADPRLGLVVGLAFGAGRALPVVALAPLAGRRAGRQVADVMAMRPRVLRGFRLANALALAGSAAVLAASGAAAATVVARGATDPSVAGNAVAWEARGRGMLLLGESREPAGAHHLGALASPLPGSDPALGSGLLAWREGTRVRVVRLADFAPVGEATVPGVDALSVSDRWLAYRARRSGVDRVGVLPIAGGRERVLAQARPSSALGRPSLAGNTAVFHLAMPRESRIVAVDLASGRARVVRRSRRVELSNPAVRDGALVYVRRSALAQALVLGPLDDPSRDRVLYGAGPVAERDPGYEPGHSPFTRTPRPARASAQLWTTALSPRAAYVTLVPLRGGAGSARIVRLSR